MPNIMQIILDEITGRLFNLRRCSLPFGWVRLRMYRSFARRLVDAKKWGMIPLYSGMQTPLLDAVSYLARIKDCASIPRLHRLLEHYLKKHDFNRTIATPGGSVTSVYGPADYVPEYVQAAVITALFTILKERDAHDLAQELLDHAHEHDLCEVSLKIIARQLGRSYVGDGYWKYEEGVESPFLVPEGCIKLQQGYRGDKNGRFIEHFLLYADRADYQVEKYDSDAEGFAWLNAELALGNNAQTLRRVKVRYCVEESGRGHIDNGLRNTFVEMEDSWDEHAKELHNLYLYFDSGVKPGVKPYSAAGKGR